MCTFALPDILQMLYQKASLFFINFFSASWKSFCCSVWITHLEPNTTLHTLMQGIASDLHRPSGRCPPTEHALSFKKKKVNRWRVFLLHFPHPTEWFMVCLPILRKSTSASIFKITHKTLLT